jgi:hypothetical protein
MENSTLPYLRVVLSVRRISSALNRYVWYLQVIGPRKLGPRVLASASAVVPRLARYARRRKTASFKKNRCVLNLQPGDWVEVRSAKEIFATLDGYDSLKGLQFTPEMANFCGKRFKVYKRVERIILEGTGELRKINSPTVLLENAICDGAAHGGCDKSCFLFWREQWLKKLAPQTTTKATRNQPEAIRSGLPEIAERLVKK